MLRYFWALSIILVTGILVSCLPQGTPPPWPTDTPLPPTETATPTIVWFPPTPSNTPLPTLTLAITPTQDLSPQHGALIISDDFTDPGDWNLGRVAGGIMALGQQELALAVSQEKGYLYSLRQGLLLSDFYLEIDASPSICRGADEYGLLLRVSPGLDFFRFGITCDGKGRVDRLLNNQASSSVPPTPNGAIPPGAPSTSRLAVWASGREMRFFANGQYLFTVRDASLLSGALGVYARASGPGAVTINYSNLQIYKVTD